MGSLIGIFEFESPIPVRGDALGETYSVKIGENTVVLHFPRLPDKPINEFSTELLAPAACIFDIQHSWGALRRYNVDYRPNTCYAEVFRVYMECQTEDPDSVSGNILSNIDEWRNLLKRIIAIKKHFVSGNLMPFTESRSSITLFKTDPEVKQYDSQSSIVMPVILLTKECCLTKEQLNEIFEIVRCGNKLKLEYELLIQAYDERSRGNYRYSLVQALSAVEVCVGNKISALCVEKGIDSKRLIGKKSLGDKFEILRAFGVVWPTPNPNEEITKHRNDLFHVRLLSPTIQQLNDVIQKVEKYLEAYSTTYFE